MVEEEICVLQVKDFRHFEIDSVLTKTTCHGTSLYQLAIHPNCTSIMKLCYILSIKMDQRLGIDCIFRYNISPGSWWWEPQVCGLPWWCLPSKHKDADGFSKLWAADHWFQCCLAGTECGWNWPRGKFKVWWTLRYYSLKKKGWNWHWGRWELWNAMLVLCLLM